MHRSPRAARTALALLAAGTLAVGLQTTASAGSGAATALPPKAPVVPQDAASHTVTLLTGDVVTVTDTGSGKSAVSIKRAPDSSGMIRTETVGKDLYVVPDAVLPYLAAGWLDNRLFDVTRLIADRYDDATTKTLPLIVKYGSGVNPSRAAVPAGSSRSLVLSGIDGAALMAQKSDAATFWSTVTSAHGANADPSFADGISTILLGGKGHADVQRVDARAQASQARPAGPDAKSYDLTLKAYDRQGAPTTMYVTVRRSDDSGFVDPVQVSGTTTLHLPAGTYSAMGWQIVTDAPDAQGLALLGNPGVRLTKNTEVDLDASKAAPVTTSIAGKRTATSFMDMEYALTSGDGYNESVVAQPTVDTMYAQPTSKTVDGFEFDARWRLRTPWMRVVAGKQELDTLQANGSPWLTGKSAEDAVYVGDGTENGYSGLDATGKVAVMSWDGSADLYTAAQVAQEHGAVFLLVVNNLPGERQWYASGPQGQDAPIPVATISGLQGGGLITRLSHGTVKVTTQGTMDTPWTYDLVETQQGSIPSNLSYTPSPSELAKITTKYYGRKPHLGGEFRYDFRPGDQYGLGGPMYMDFPATRTEWVSAEPGTQWYQGIETIDGSWDLRGDKVTYQHGEHTTESWMAPVVYPRLGPGYWNPDRQYDTIQLNLPSFGDGGYNHTGGMDTQLTDQKISVYQGDTLLKSSEGWQSINVSVSPDKLLYHATSDVTRDPKAWTTSTRIHSEYDFWSEHDDGMSFSYLPLVQVGFHVNTDIRGDAKAGSTDTIGLTAWQLPNVVDGGDLAGGGLSVSYDGGQTWTPLTLTGDTGNWQATVTYPKDPSKWVSLKATAWDTEGNKSSQTIIRAFGLH